MADYIEYREKIVDTLSGKPIHYLVPTQRIPIPENARCKFCGSRNLVRYGKYKDVQRYFCQDCRRKSADNGALPKMKIPPEVIGTAISMYYEGLSFDAISRQLWQLFHVEPSKSTIYGWVVRYSNVADRLAKDLKPKTGVAWIVDETVLDIGGTETWFWDCIDEKTRFLIASHLSQTRTTKDAETLMRKARDKTERSPKFIISDKLAAYLDGIDRVFGGESWHIQSEGFSGDVNTNLVERFHGTLKGRTKIMRGMKSNETARLILSGWLIHYNFFRPHESLGKKTPAQVAGIRFPYGNWKDIARGGY